MGDVYQHLHCFIHPRYCISFFKITDLHVEKLAGKVNHGRASDTNITRGCLVYTCKKYRASAKKLQELDDSHSRKMCICIYTCIQYLYIYMYSIYIYTHTQLSHPTSPTTTLSRHLELLVKGGTHHPWAGVNPDRLFKPHGVSGANKVREVQIPSEGWLWHQCLGCPRKLGSKVGISGL